MSAFDINEVEDGREMLDAGTIRFGEPTFSDTGRDRSLRWIRQDSRTQRTLFEPCWTLLEEGNESDWALFGLLIVTERGNPSVGYSEVAREYVDAPKAINRLRGEIAAETLS